MRAARDFRRLPRALDRVPLPGAPVECAPTSRPWLWLALALHVVLATVYATRTPDFEGPDENGHYEYTQHLANAGGLPLSPAVQQARGLPQTEPGCARIAAGGVGC